MIITCSFNDFQTLSKDSNSTKFGGAVIYVGSPGTGVTKASLLNTSRLGVVFLLSNTPSQAQFLAQYPGAIKVDEIV